MFKTTSYFYQKTNLNSCLFSKRQVYLHFALRCDRVLEFDGVVRFFGFCLEMICNGTGLLVWCSLDFQMFQLKSGSFTGNSQRLRKKPPIKEALHYGISLSFIFSCQKSIINTFSNSSRSSMFGKTQEMVTTLFFSCSFEPALSQHRNPRPQRRKKAGSQVL